MVCYIVTMGKVQIIVSDETHVEPLSKMYTIQLIFFFCGQNSSSESTLPILESCLWANLSQLILPVLVDCNIPSSLISSD